MKILHISNYLYPHIGGIEQVARDCADALNGKCEQKFICFNHEKGTSFDILDGIETVRVGCQLKLFSQSIAFGYAKQLKKLIKDFNPDTILFHYPNPFVAHYLLKYIKSHIKLIIYWHLDITKQKLLGKLFRGQNKRLIKRADKIIATSPNYIEGSPWLSKVKDKCSVVSCAIFNNGFEISDNVKKIASDIRENNKDKTICFALGRHVPYKGIEYLVKASKLLDNNFKVYIGGKGPLTEQLKKMAKGDPKIEFLGRLSDDELSAYFYACDIFCFPSITKNEAFGIALAEGMSYGKPAVTFTIPGSGVNYVSLNEVTGIEVENCNVQAYADALKKLAEDKALREFYGDNARSRVKDNFIKSKFISEINKLILN